MHRPTLCVLKRFQKPNFAINHQMNSKTNDVGLPTTQKPHTNMLDIEKVSDNSVIYSERNILSWLHKVAPCFPVNGSKITIIDEPNDFYTTILEKCKTAKKRITLASLYLGTGSLESKLVKGIEEALHSNNGNIKVKILLDCMRGSRGDNNSRKMLEPLLKVYGDCCQVFLYHTPKLRGILKIVTPDRLNELIGLQHMKLYMVDDTLIISGANLSNDYFTNRQDRYFMIEDCRDLCNFYNELVEKVGEFSFLLQSDGTTILNSSTNPHPYKDSKKEFAKEARNSIESLLQDKIYKCVRNRVGQINVTEQSSDTDTWIFPLVQMGQLNIQHDSEVTLKLLQTAPAGATIRLATGYFNLTTEYINAILKCCRATCHILTAHPTTNGFFNAKGVAGNIPAAYTKIEELFCKRCERMNQQNRVTLWEFIKPEWTYHAKGLWYYLPDQSRPFLTLIGSPNFGYRSVRRDLETQVAIVTKNEKLQIALHKEQTRLFSYAKPVTKQTFFQEDRVPPAWVRVGVMFFRYFF